MESLEQIWEGDVNKRDLQSFSRRLLLSRICENNNDLNYFIPNQYG